MILPDVNVLVHASRADSLDHDRCRAGGLNMEEYRINRHDLIALTLVTWLLAVVTFTGVGALLSTWTPLPRPPSFAIGFLLAAIFAYPVQKIWQQHFKRDVSFVRYASIWFGASVFGMCVMGLLNG